MSRNRLFLNWQLNSQEERAAFIETYLPTLPSPTEEELSTIADYILWGKRNGEKDRAFQIEPRNKTWVRNREESLETLQMSLTFNEGELSRPGPAYTRPNPVFSRENARAMAPASLLPEFEALWRTIDQLDIRIQTYELLSGKRKQIVPALLERLTPDEIEQAQQDIVSWSSFFYLKQRHQIVELRNQQYSMRDLYNPPKERHTEPYTDPLRDDLWTHSIGTDYAVRPLGLLAPDNFSSLIYRTPLPTPDDYTTKEFAQLCAYVSRLQDPDPTYHNSRYIDLRQRPHLSLIVKNWDDLQEAAPNLLHTFNFFVAAANLTPVALRTLSYKRQGKLGSEIAALINKEFGTHYSPNYISTIYQLRCLKPIATAVQLHYDNLMALLSDPEGNFCCCSKCGCSKLHTPLYFKVRNGKTSEICRDCARKGKTK